METLGALRKTTRLRGYTVSKTDLVALCRLLQEQANAAAEIEVRDWIKHDDESSEEFEEKKANLKALFQVYVRIETQKGENVSEAPVTSIDAPSLPEEISRIEILTSHYFLRVANRDPSNQAYVLLDFRRYHPAGAGFQPTNATPNDSQIIVTGDNSDWVSATKSKLDDFFRSRKRNAAWLHGEGIYDVFLQIVGIFFIAWCMSVAVPRIDGWFKEADPTYKYAGYIFAFMISLRIFMFIFSYARWMWPLSEIRNGNYVSKTHRAIWFAIVIGLITTLIYDLGSKIG